MPTTTEARPAVIASRWPTTVGLVRLSEGAHADGFHRSWVQLFPEGHFTHEQYGELDFTRARLERVKRQFDERVRHIDIALDANHDQDKATGWLEQVQMRPAGTDPKTGEPVPAGLWGLVRWTPLGLSYLHDQIYRYFSPEFGPWTDPETGRRYKDVLLGGGLTNRPFLKRMGAVQLAEASTRPWSQVDKTCLPDSAFLDPKGRRLPIYEGAGPKDSQGRYTQRGKLNLNGLKAAWAAVHGARTGEPMAGLPSGTVAKLQRLRQQYGLAGTAPGGAQAASEQGRRTQGMATAGKKVAAGKSRREREADLEAMLFGEGPDDEETDDNGAEEDGSEELTETDSGMRFAAKKAKKEDVGSGGEDDPDDPDDDGKPDEGMGDGEEFDDTTDGGMDNNYEMDDDEEEDTPPEGVSGRAATKQASISRTRSMSKKASEGGRRGMSLAEQIQMRERLAAVEYKLYESAVDAQLDAWAKGGRVTLAEGGKPTKQTAPVALSRTFREAYRFFMLKEGVTLSERSRTGISKLVNLALHDAIVDLSTRGSSFDQETRRTVRGSNDLARRGPQSAQQSDALQEHATRLAETRFNKALDDLDYAEKLQVFTEAAGEVKYR